MSASQGSGADSRQALEELCRAYWYPLYAFIRRDGCSPHDAQDLTQGFFVWLLESDRLTEADPARGRFRSFLLIRLKGYLSDERKRASAQKRGGGVNFIFLDMETAEDRYRFEPVAELTPERIFDRRWALTILERTVQQLQEEYEADGRGSLFAELRKFQLGDKAGCSYVEVAERLSLTESAIKSAIWRLRQRHRELVRQAIAETVADPDEIDGEIRHLLSVIGS